MKKALILLTSALAMMAIAAAPGCSGGGDDDDDDDDDGSSLSTGTYAVSGAGLTNTCTAGTTSYYDGVTEADVTVTGLAITITGFPDELGYDIVGTNLVDNLFGTPQTIPLDYTDNTSADYPLDSGNEYACKLDYTVEYAGTITGADAFTLEDSITVVVTSGNQCTPAVVSSAFNPASPILAVPCSSVDSVDLAL